MEIGAILALLAANWETISIIIVGIVALYYKLKDISADKGGAAIAKAIEDFESIIKANGRNPAKMGVLFDKAGKLILKDMVTREKGKSALATAFVNRVVGGLDPKLKKAREGIKRTN